MPAPATGRKQAGVVLSKRGKVTARAAGAEVRILKRGDPIYVDDMVSTVRGANAHLKMQDHNVVILRGGCTFRVNIYHPQAGGSGRRYEYAGGVLRESQRGTPGLTLNG